MVATTPSTAPTSPLECLPLFHSTHATVSSTTNYHQFVLHPPSESRFSITPPPPPPPPTSQSELEEQQYHLQRQQLQHHYPRQLQHQLQPQYQTPPQTTKSHVYNFPIMPMVASSSDDDDDEDDEEERDAAASLVSSLSLDDSLLMFQRYQHQVGIVDDLLTPFPPTEIVVQNRLEKAPSTPSSTLSPLIVPDWLIDTYQAPPTSPLSSSSASPTLAKQELQSSTQLPVETPHLAQVPNPVATATEPVQFKLYSPPPAPREPFQSPGSYQTPYPRLEGTLPRMEVTPLARPELGRRSTFPKAVAPTTTAPHYHHPYHAPAPHHPSRLSATAPLPSLSEHSRYVPPRPTHRTVQTDPALPMDRIWIQGSFCARVQGPVPEHAAATSAIVMTTGTSASSLMASAPLTSSPEDAALLGQRRRRLVAKGVSGTLSVGSVVGQSSFYTAPTTCSSTGGGGAGVTDSGAAELDPTESFRQHLRVQRKLNTLVADHPDPRSRHHHPRRAGSTRTAVSAPRIIQRECHSLWKRLTMSPVRSSSSGHWSWRRRQGQDQHSNSNATINDCHENDNPNHGGESNNNNNSNDYPYPSSAILTKKSNYPSTPSHHKAVELKRSNGCLT